ncbi:MAG: hypothetical protein ACK5PZ_11645 [Pirellula sp.]
MQLGQGVTSGQNIAVAWFGPTDGCWDWLLQHFEQVTLLSEGDIREWLDLQSGVSSAAISPKGPSKDAIAPNKTTKTSSTKSTNSKNTRAKNLGAKNSAPSDRSDAVLLVAFEHRNDPRLRVWQSSHTSFLNNSTRIATVLGSDWQGHRRTFPLSDSVESFYWFQLFDRIVPWLLSSSEVQQQGLVPSPASLQSQDGVVDPAVAGRKSKSTSSTSGSGANPRVQRLLEINDWYPVILEQLATRNQLAWIISDHREQRMAWQETLVSYGVRTVASRPGDAQFWATPDLIVVDCLARDDHPSGQITGSLKEGVIHARGMYPDAFMVLVDPFPGWRRWESWLELGVDALVPRPADFAGVLVSWQLWARAGSNNAILR